MDNDAGQETLAHVEALADRLARPVRQARRAPAADFAGALEKIATQRKRLVDAIARGLLSDDDARDKIRQLDADAAGVRERQDADAQTRRPVPANLRRAALADIRVIENKWARMAPPVRREVVAILSDEIVLARPATARKWARGAFDLRMTWREIGEPARLAYTRPRLTDLPGAGLARVLVPA